jgi:hypothetical protein
MIGSSGGYTAVNNGGCMRLTGSTTPDSLASAAQAGNGTLIDATQHDHAASSSAAAGSRLLRDKNRKG